MKSFQHFIITRFNVRVDYSKSRAGINPDWLSHRFKLFDQFCYSSVRGQSNQNFKWLVFFDSETPEYFKSKIKKYAEWQNFIPLYIDCEFTSQINHQAVLNYLKSNTEYLITTRLDNDDAVSKDFVQLIQNSFTEQEFEFINFTSGYVWNHGKLYSFDYPNNPFVSLIEKVNQTNIDGFKTIACGQHTELYLMGQIKQIKTKPTWLQVIHEQNVSNRIRGIREPIKKLGDDFFISSECIPKQEPLVPYLLDKSFSLMKAPIDSLVLALPKDTRARLRKVWQMINGRNF
ncbi:glycosyltransferase [Calothrix sp. PCC 7507]|uniref:glycosyltransferase n=1 Tax=Calothrix sp. PCC 7507 TaxID=99598 RepID=UPI00029F1B9E|nr:glycosyltransferase [Calothrix sp. PCC 7507]AFY32499.1 hypothetical protein Cal7507_2056 [Calothrix sp. PCC 7507]